MIQALLRGFFVALSRAGWARRAISAWGVARRAAGRFVAGDTLAEAITAVRALNAQGMAASLDHLGENTSSAQEAAEAADEVIRAVEGLAAAGARAGVSLKLTQIGLLLEEGVCRAHLARILACAREHAIFVRIDMEDSPLTERTLAMWKWALEQGFTNVGVVLQAYLYRTAADLAMVAQHGGRVRLCKGAYAEPAAVAFPQKSAVDENFDRLTTALLESAVRAGLPTISADGCTPPIPAIATHDAARVAWAQAEAQRLGVPHGALEFQLLYGIRRDLQAQLVGQGYPVRVYVPYGTHWYPYFMRRLAERPANVGFFLRNFFKA